MTAGDQGRLPETDGERVSVWESGLGRPSLRAGTGRSPRTSDTGFAVSGTTPSQSPHVARAATRYVAAAISLPPRWLQRMGWFRRPLLTPCARPSDTAGGGDA